VVKSRQSAPTTPQSGGDNLSVHHAVTVWIEGIKAGDSQSAQELWELYFGRMVDLARRRLEGVRRTAADEEDVAISAFKSFCIGARDGRFTRLSDRHNLWPLLLTITANKSVDLIRRQNRQKRGGTGTAGETDFKRVAVPLSDILSSEPEPAFASAVAEELETLLTQLDATGDSDLKRIALWKMDGETTTEIAGKLSCVRRTVERKLDLIARAWARDFAE